MATNKNALTRYLTLDRCFRNPGKDYTMASLVEECTNALQEINPESTGVQRRQVYEDVKFMQDPLGYNAPIETRKDGRFSYYFYEDRNFSITNQPINEQEAQQLKDTILTLSRFKGMPQFDWMEEMVTRLGQTFKLESEQKVMSFDENQYLTGRKYIGDLYQAIVNQQCLEIIYQPYKRDEPSSFTIHPYHLKEYNRRWFLFGLSDGYTNLTSLALDRILSISKNKTAYTPNATIDFEEYFDDVVGVSVDQAAKVERVVLKVDPSLFPYVKSKPLHHTQIAKSSDEPVVLKLQINYELKSLLFSYMDAIEVLEPATLREEFKQIAEKIKSRYK